ncbi:conserved hypothetical protein [Methylobacterium sp. 4-46]|uniref:hypothetical protein n=1 Tax=unclassified Methylobacterium TaxID=2615210 RepID=UPI000152D508|nr:MULTISPECIES: hypothetical protein [Methylobacterium]ACA20348.1 conserved hypothetical protein [Methylobacterium sp. 4-46]WFT79519.1 hypothetical protein QA634_30630 [Methylobacterium nodulans]
MTLRLPLAAMLAALAAAPALAASCEQDIAALEPRLSAQTRDVISTSTASKEVSSRREAQGEAARSGNVPPSALPKGPEPGSGEAKAAAEAGTGTGAMEARASLNGAREAARKGDEAGCRQALDRARAQLDGR